MLIRGKTGCRAYGTLYYLCNFPVKPKTITTIVYLKISPKFAIFPTKYRVYWGGTHDFMEHTFPSITKKTGNLSTVS